MSEIYSLIKRLENIEAILQLEYGTLDVGELTRRKEESHKFYEDMKQRFGKLNADLKEQNKVLTAQSEEWRLSMQEGREKREKLMKELGVSIDISEERGLQT